MKIYHVKYIRAFINMIVCNLLCFLLLLKNMFLIRVLRLESVTVFDSVAIEGNEVLLYWRVKGCHKIKMHGHGSFSGNIPGLKIKILDIYKPIVITYHGLFKKITKEILVPGSRIDILHDFNSKSILTRPKETAFQKQELCSVLSNSRIVWNFEIVPAVFEDFEYEKYKPITK